MRTERFDGAGDDADNALHERLTRRFHAELAQAQRDYPDLGIARRTSAPSGRRAPVRTGWPRFASMAVAIGLLAVVGIVGAGVAFRPGQVAGPQDSSVPRGADGIPTEIDGQRVYRITDKAEWQNLTGSFLLGGYPFREVASCPTIGQPQPSPEAAVIPPCGGLGLGPTVGSDATTGGVKVASVGSDALTAWVDGPAIVARVNTHDPRAAQCGADNQAACEAAVVVEAVVWPNVPTEIGGQPVYRAADQASFASMKGGFLLGGRFAKPEFVPPCPAPIGKSDAEQQLIPYCYLLQIDGLQIAPRSSIDEPNNEIVVARVHVNDDLAAQCPVTDQADCQAAIVVESVVWRSGDLVSPTPAASPSVRPFETAAGSPGVGVPPSSGPVASAIPVGQDGVPTELNGQMVFRASALPNEPTFLLGGPLTRDACPEASWTAAKRPVCGYWMLDGVIVGTQVSLDGATAGEILVAQVSRAQVLGICSDGSCGANTLVIVEIVYPYLEVPPPPSPTSAVP